MLTITNAKKTGPSIALCVIAKNEEDMIAGCLDSARDFVDEMVVVDTGSTDRTVEIAQAHGAKVVSFEWINDFAAARNHAIEHATSDWIIMLDADERLAPESGPLLRTALSRPLPDGYFAVCLQIENIVQGKSMAHYMTRFFPRHPQLRFVGRIHEELKPQVPDLGNAVLMLPEIRIIHHGYEPAIYQARRKDERNMSMLLAELDQEPDNARLLYYVLQQHAALRRHEEALPYAERFLAVKGQMRQAFEVEVTRMQLECLYALNRREEAAKVLDTASTAGAMSSYAFEMVGNFERQLGHSARAAEMYELARNESLPAGLWGRPTGQEWELHTKIADCRWELGQHRRALAEVEKALPLVHETRRRAVAFSAVQQCLGAHQFAAAYRWSAHVHALSNELSEHFEVVDLIFRLPTSVSRTGDYALFDRAVAQQAWQKVYDLGLQLPLHDKAGLARLLRVSTRMIDEEAPDAALDLLGRAMDAFPTEALVYWNLARALNALGRHEDAANALSVIEQLNQSDSTTLAIAA